MSHRPAEAIHGAAGETVSTEGALVPGAAEAGASAGSGEASLAEALAEAEELLTGLALDLQLVALDLVEFPRALATHLSDLPAPFRLGLDILRRLLTDVVVQLLYSLAVAEGIDAGRRIGRQVIGRKCCCWYCCHLLCPCSPVEGRGLQIHRGREAKTQHCRRGGTAGQPRGARRRRRRRLVLRHRRGLGSCHRRGGRGAAEGELRERALEEAALAAHSYAALRRGDGLQELRHVREMLGVRRLWRRRRRSQLPLRICGRCCPLQPLDLPGLRCHVLPQQPGVVTEHGRPLKSLDLCWLRKCTTNTTRFQMRPVNIGSVLARSIVLRGGMPQLRAHRISLLTDVGHAQILAAPPHTRKGLEVVDGLRGHMYGRLHFRPWR
mmetsp:Transcript_125911/g.403091  ORF Transcript_125911/g.403091 Transcript_125911/m.403091 type:complete len:380 (+) Transcript_125911:2096-3235(+)